ncbi:hypothetical protein K8R47_03060 [archaeon]|nr:hypothetical protein [archaeon]
MKKVKIKEVLQAFIISDELKKEYGEINNISEYKEIYNKIKNKIKKYSEKELWQCIKDKNRIIRYKSCDWYFGRIKISNTGVWPHMGHIVDNLLFKDTKWTANQIFKNSNKILKGELNHLFRILPFVSYLNKHIPIITIQNSAIRDKEKYLKEMCDIDDGCHRTICLALQGRTFINAYIGIQKKI